MMRYQDIAKKKQRVKRLFWILLILLLGLVSSGWLYPLGAEVLLCGDPLFPDPDGIYRLRGHLTCLPTDPDTDPILDIKGDDVADSKFDLRGLIATGDGDNTGIRIRDGADNVTIVGGIFKKCKTALRVEADDCDIENFKAIDSSGRAFRIKGDYNDIVKSLCLKAGEACFEVEGEYNDLIRLKAIDSSENAIIEKKGSDNNFLSRCMSLRAGSDAFELRANGLHQKKHRDYLKPTPGRLGKAPARQRCFLGHCRSSPPQRASAPVRGQKLPPQGGVHQVGRKQTQTLWMKKGKLFLRHRYGKAERIALDPDSPRTSEQAGDIPKQTDCARKGPTI